MNHLQGEININKMMNHLFDQGVNQLFKSDFSNNHVDTNLVESEKSFSFELAIPGMSKDHIHLKLEENVLIVETIENEKEEEIKFLSKEFDFEVTKRHLKLPKNIDRSKIKAAYKDGVLVVTMHKKKEEVLKKTAIEIK